MGHRIVQRVPLDFDHPVGDVWPGYLSPPGLTDEEYEAWRPTDPPEGEGWQLWETTSEGSPVSPVFGSAVELANWCADNATWFADFRWTADQWLQSITAGTVGPDSIPAITVRGGP
jgi:hypothetical protein